MCIYEVNNVYWSVFYLKILQIQSGIDVVAEVAYGKMFRGECEMNQENMDNIEKQCK